MKRAVAGASSSLVALRLGRTATPSFRSGAVCLFCQHQARTSQAPFSSTTSTHLRKRPNRAQTSSALEAEQAAQTREAGSSQSADEGIVLGGEYSAAEAKADERAYERRRAIEDREAFQKSVDDAPEQHYIKASNWDGLEMVGGEKQWPYAARRHFEGFLPAAKINDTDRINQAIHRATIEVYLAQSQRRPTRKLPNVAPEDLADSQALYVKIEPASDGSGLNLQFPIEAVRKDILGTVGIRMSTPKPVAETPEDSLAQPIKAHNADLAEDAASSDIQAAVHDIDTASESPVDTRAAVLVADRAVGSSRISPTLENTGIARKRLRKVVFNTSWGNVPISHPSAKLAIVRRVTQLTGHVFPDTIIESATTIRDLSQYIIKSVQKPKTLFEALVGPAPAAESNNLLEELLGPESSTEVRGNPSLNLEHVPGQKKGPLAGLANVVVSGRRVSPVDREKPMGRWKVIEAELDRRRLPVVGRD